jgi:hypothetical protein
VQKLFKIPLAFFFIASCIGLLLRFQLISPIDGIVYSYLLHAHSHVMFLGWVLNVLIIAFTIEFIEVKNFKALFWFLQVCVIGMLISFPLQGYGGFSITFSSLHTFGVFVFIGLFFRSSKNKPSLSLTLAKASLLFFAISSIGPFSLAYLKTNGLEHSNLYRFSIYFYLHFQYNGFFLFGVLSLLMKLLESKMSSRVLRGAKLGSYILICSCLPAYFLSILWSQPTVVFNIIGFASALAQLVGLYFLLRPLLKLLPQVNISQQEKLLFSSSFVAVVLKSILQLISAYPAIAIFVNEFRSIVIAYLHLILVGFISLFLIAWLMTKRVIESRAPWSIRLILSGFIGSETLLAISPWNSALLQISTSTFNNTIFMLSVLIVLGLGIMLTNRVVTNASYSHYNVLRF